MSDMDSSVNGDGKDAPQLQGPKRKVGDAGFNANGSRPGKSVKRRASKACQCCRARKVRCNVVEQTPCTNCRLDEVECIVSESKRKKKWTKIGDEHVDAVMSQHGDSTLQEIRASSPSSIAGFAVPQAPSYANNRRASEHVPHTLYQELNGNTFNDSPRQRAYSQPMPPPPAPSNLLADLTSIDPSSFLMPQMPTPAPPSYSLPPYIKALPSRIGPDEIMYLTAKGALTIPTPSLRNALIRSYTEFVYPYMPLLDIHEFIQAIDNNDSKTPISLLLFQAVMFASVASVGMKHLRSAGYLTRRDARRDFFQKTRLLYDFDIEQDRVALVQSLLLMTVWYETPDDQKDSHHWMGIAVSLSHTIGLHRNPERSNMDSKRKKLWKRIWWCTFMRDRLIALGMRRPTKIKDEDWDVPMLTLDDFDFATVLPTSCAVSQNSTLMQDTAKQRDLAVMCIEKAKLCMCISHVLSTQYSVLHNNHGVLSAEGSTRTTMMLVAKKNDPEVCGVGRCDEELRKWKEELPTEVQYKDTLPQDMHRGDRCIVLHRSLLHMIYYATSSALHRPQVLPSTAWPQRQTSSEILESSRKSVRHAATEITRIAQRLSELDLVRYFPTTGITVLLPAIIIHLLDIKAPDETTRRASLQGFCQCMQIMSKLRDIYAAADYSTAFLEAAIRKAEITLPVQKENNKEKVITSTAGLVDAGRRMQLIPNPAGRDASRLTPPPEQNAQSVGGNGPVLHHEDNLAKRLETFLASTPDSDDHDLNLLGSSNDPMSMGDFEPDFEALLDLDAAGEAFVVEDGAFATMQGEGGGFAMDMSWMKGVADEGGEVNGLNGLNDMTV